MRVAIVGGGICGLYLAWKLSGKGHNVTVFERKGKIGEEVCSGLFSKRILEFIPESRKLIKNQINHVILNFPRKTAEVEFSKSFFVISHFELDRLTADLAQKSGAKIILNQNISSLPEGFEPVRNRARALRARRAFGRAVSNGFDRIIGCDGANSFIRRSLNLPEPTYRLGILGFVRKPCSENYVETWPCRDGFIWRIPRGEEVEYGILAEPKEARLIFEQFLKKENIILEGIKSKIVPQGLITVSNPLITLCGDAIGLTKPWSGGGVVWGLTGAEILLKTFPDFLKYKKAMRRFFIPKIIFSKTAVKLVYFLGYKLPWFLPRRSRMESDFLL